MRLRGARGLVQEQWIQHPDQEVNDENSKDRYDGSAVRGADRLRVATGKKSVGDAGGFYRS